MSDDIRQVKCAKCRVPVNVVPDPKPEDMVTCPECGDSDTFENVHRPMGEQAQEYAARVMQDSLSRMARNSKGFVKYTPGVVPKGSHRFIIEFD